MRAIAASISDEEREAWLAANAVMCHRYKSRISPSVCDRYRLVDPVNCKGCQRLEGHEQEAPPTSGWHRTNTVRQMVRSDEVKRKQNRKAVCVECGHEKAIIGRGRCGGCYAKDRKREAMPADCQQPAVPAENDQTTQRHPLSVVDEGAKVSTDPPVVRVALDFVGDDLELYKALQQLAAKDRRSVDNEILCIIELYLEGQHAGK